MVSIPDRHLSAPVANPETAPFWEAAAQGRFLLRWCRACDRTHWFPRAVCPHCLSIDSEWREASGRGVIYAYSAVESADPPYIVALVTLSEGPTMTTNLVDCETEDLAIGQPAELVWKETTDGRKLPMFRPVAT